MNQRVRLDAIDEMRDTYILGKLANKTEMAERHQPTYASPCQGDLVVLRGSVLDTQRGRKLEPKWDGPYLLSRILKNGRAEAEIRRRGKGRMRSFA